MKPFLEPLTPDEEKIYIEKMRLGDKKAKDILIERNLRLVAHVVKKYYDENRENQDLISIGIVGLIKAVNTYNPDKCSSTRRPGKLLRPPPLTRRCRLHHR